MKKALMCDCGNRFVGFEHDTCPACGKVYSEVAREARRRAQLREAQARYRRKQRKLARMACADAGAQITLSLSAGAVAVLTEIAKAENKSRSLVIEEMIMGSRKAKAAKAKLRGMFPGE